MEANLTTNEYRLLNIMRMRPGSDNGFSRAELVEKSGIKDVMPIIHALRVKKMPICRKHRKYFFAAIDEDIYSQVKQLEAELAAVMDEIGGLKASSSTPGKIMVTLPVRRGGKVAYEKFDVDNDGNPIVPEGTVLV
jgi:hypothetical protein